jgi:endonuclease-3 related protein
MTPNNPNKILKLYKKLSEKYKSDNQWKTWCKRPKTEKGREEIIIEAILTQRANWKNVEIAVTNLKKAKAFSLKKIYKLKNKKSALARLIKPTGFYRQKTDYLLGLTVFIVENYGSAEKMMKEPLERLRSELLSLKGVGPETADSILLYALDKPSFVIDEYTRRLGLSKNISYEHLKKLFESSIKKDYRLFQKFHALIVIDGKNKPQAYGKNS